MCLAVPAKIVALDGDKATIEVDGVRRTVSTAFIENPQPGDYVLIHAGFAIRKWSEEDVAEYRRIVGSVGDAEDGND